MKKTIILWVSLLICCGDMERRQEVVRISQGKEFFSVRVFGLLKPTRVRLALYDDIPVRVVSESETAQAQLLPAESEINILDKNFLSVRSRDKNIVARSRSIKLVLCNENDFYGGFLLEVEGKIRRKYIGGFEIVARNSELVLLVKQRLEDLVRTIVASESSVEDSLEYLKAQAVITRTFIIANVERHKEEGFDFCDNTHCQVFFGEDKANEMFKQSVIETRGNVLVWGDRIADVFFTGACGGETAIPQTIWGEYVQSYPYQSVKCNHCADSKFYRWRTEVEKSKLAKVFFGRVGKSLAVRIQQRFVDGRPQSVMMINGKEQIALSADRFRIELGRHLGWNTIHSDWFDIVQSDKRNIVFEGRGFGHGVGFCQEGAKKLGKMGIGFREILSYYYPKASIGLTEIGHR